MTVGERVVDLYTNRAGRILALDEARNRVTVALVATATMQACRMTGCLSWFAPLVQEDAA